MSDVWQALSHPARRHILSTLRGGPRSAGELAGLFDFSAPTLSGHLRSLREANLVTCDADGNRRIYHLNLSVAEDALTGLLGLLRVGDTATPEETSP